jgi:uncharacterized membrane-anchored protein YitT (DUF2179 family)
MKNANFLRKGFRKLLKDNRGQLAFTWKTAKDMLLITLGAVIQGFALRMFLIPGQLISGGVSGAAQIIQVYTNWPIGLMILVGNAPLFVLGWRYLGGLRFALRTAIAILVFSISIDYLGYLIPESGITGDVILETLYGGIIYGVGCGLVYRGQGTSGGSDILARILNYYFGMSLTRAYLIVDAVVVLGGGFAFGWDLALYGMVVIYISGLGAEYISEGRNVFRSAMIITSHPKEIADRVMRLMGRGVTILSATGAYTGEPRPMLYCVVTRAEVNKLKNVIREVDPKAFSVIGQASEALGEGFRPLKE